MPYSSYRRRITSLGATLRDQEINKQKFQISQYAENTPSFKQVEIEGVPRGVIITSTQVLHKKNIYSMPNETILPGQIVLWDDGHYIITETDGEDTFYTRGSMSLCNAELKWQDDTTGKICSCWSTIDKRNYSSSFLGGTTEIETSEREYSISIPYNDETANIEVGKRFLIDVIAGKPKAYRITSVDVLSKAYILKGVKVGVVILNFEQDLYNPITDRIDLMVCDYKTMAQTAEYNMPDIEYKGNATVRIGGSKKKFGINVKDGLNGHWYIEASDKLKDNLLLTDGGNEVWIKVKDDITLTGEKLILSFVDIDNPDNFSAIEVEVVS